MMFRIKKYTLIENLISIIIGIIIGSILAVLSIVYRTPSDNYKITSSTIEISTDESMLSYPETDDSTKSKEETSVKSDYTIQLYYIAQCVEAEAGNQDEYGKRLVADVIINRYNSGNYRNYCEVINEKNQFAVVANGSIDCVPSEETYRIVAEELECQTNTEVLYFRTDYYHSFGTSLFKYQEHYFSK